jgi:conjugal transfer mating pair stabilization protein TraG
MEFTIYTSGSIEFLEIMLNSTAMIMGSGSAEDVAKIGAMLGLLILAFQAVFSNQPIGFQKPALLLVLYAMFFGPVSTVILQDSVSNQARVVDNIPIGPAFVGSTISTIAHGIAQIMEQSTSQPGMTEYGLFSSLQTMSAIRDTLRNPTSSRTFNDYGKSAGKNLPRTFRAHMTFCVGNPSELDTTSIEERERATNALSEGALNAIQSNRDSQYTQVYDGTEGPGLPATKTCRESSDFIATAYRELLPDLMQEILENGFSSDFKQGRFVSGSQLLMSTQSALDSFSMTSKAAQEYVVTSSIISNFNNGRAEAIQHWHGSRAAVALRDSLNQQELQWAGRGDVFKHYMRPMISFFEGLLYALTPFMAFALMLGGPGISILSKYLILPLAVGMWLPLLSIVNAFTLWYAGAQIDPILSSYDPGSTGFALAQMTDLDHAVSKALGVGGLLASSVPALALFIVSGSAYVANSIMSNMTSGDKFKSEDITPRVQDPSSALATTAMFTQDQTTAGVSRTGSREKSVQFSGQQAYESSVQSARTQADESMQNYTDKLGAAVTQGFGTAEGQQFTSSLGQQTMSSLDLSSNSQFQEAKSTLQSLGYSEEQIAAGTFTAQAGLGVNLGITAGSKAQESEQVKNMSSEQRQQAENAMATIGNVVTSRSSESDVFQAGQSYINGSNTQMGVTNSDELSSTLSSAQKDSQTYQTAQSNKDSLAAQQSLDLKQVAANALTGGTNAHGSAANAARNAEEAFFTTPEDRQMLAGNLRSVVESGISSNDSEQRMAATALTLQQQGRFGELVNSEYSPFNISPSTGNAHQNAGVGQVGGAEGIQGRFEAARTNNSDTISGSGIGDGHNMLRDQASGVMDSAQVANAGVVAGHNDASNAYLADQDSPATADLGNVDSVQPITDHNRDSANAARESWGQFKEKWNNVTDSIRGVEDGPPPPPTINPSTGEVWTSDVPAPWEAPGPSSTSPVAPKPGLPKASVGRTPNLND